MSITTVIDHDQIIETISKYVDGVTLGKAK
jgi:hypothetical protein